MKDHIFSKNDPSDIILRQLEVHTLDPAMDQQFNDLLDQEHYLGRSKKIGDTLKQVITYKGQWVALLQWGPCAYRLKDRDEWIGWDPNQAKERKKLIVQNRRFLVLGKARKPNLASKSLALAVQHLPDAWLEEYGYKPALAETFTDPEQFEGTCYKASGWIPLGFSQGFKRHRTEYYVDEKHPKKLWVKPLHNQGRYWLRCHNEHVPAFCRKGLIKDSPDRSLPLKADQIRSLKEHLSEMPDPRHHNCVYKISSLLSIVTIGLLCGYSQLTQIQRLGNLLTQQQRRWLGLPLKKGTSSFYSVPSYNAYYNLLKQIELEALASHLSVWAEEQAGNLPEALAIDGKSIGDRVYTISLVDHETGTPKLMDACTTNGKEIEQGQKLIRKARDLDNTMIPADALHCQKKRLG